MKGIIIAGGQGTRLRPLTYNRPKPLMPVVNRPFLEYQVALLQRYGVEDIVFATNYMADKIEDHFGDGSRFGVRMKYAVEDSPLGTGGAIRNAADLFPGESVCVFNGDVLSDFDLGKILKYHTENRAMATITLQPVPSPNPFGVLKLDEQGQVLSWIEPTEEQKKALAQQQNVIPTGTDLINAGFYVFDSAFIATIPQGVKSSVERDIFPPLIASRSGIYGIAPGGYWMDLGRPEQLMTATRALLTGVVKTFTDDHRNLSPTGISKEAIVDELCSIGSSVLVGSGSLLQGCIIQNNVTIGKSVVLKNVVIDENSVIQDDVVIEGQPDGPTPVIASDSTIRQGTQLRST